MERPVFQPVETPAKELDTPALLLDLDVVTSNIQDCISSSQTPAPRSGLMLATNHMPPYNWHMVGRRMGLAIGLSIIIFV